MEILIVGDYELVRKGLSSIVSEEFISVKITEADSVLTEEKLIRSGKCSLIIMDVSMPDKLGLDMLKYIRLKYIKVLILILSIHPENQYALRVLRAGGNGYITTGCAITKLINVMKIILSGKKYISTDVAEKLASRFYEDVDKEEHELISDRELQVLKLFASGKTVSEIAQELSLSIATVSTYRVRLLEKMNLKNNAELVLYAINNKLV